MIHTKVVGDDIIGSLQILTKYVPQVALEMMSRAGNAVRVEQRRALTSSKRVYYVTREDMGKKYLSLINYGLPFGHRESKNKDANPDNMVNFINSYLMESAMTLVVNGTHPSFIPILRRDGEVVGAGSRVKGVGKETHAILERMNDDRESRYYPTRDKLKKGKIGSHYADIGNRNAQPKAMQYLLVAYGEALERIELNKRTQQQREL